MTLPLSEPEMQRGIIEQARWLGFRVHHDRPAQTSRGWRTPIEGDAGFPDLVLALDGYVLAWELKTRRGKVSDEQAAWGEAMTGRNGVAVVEYGVIRPDQYDDALAALDRIAHAMRR